ncbi:hypothetical protein [Streptomyces mirabilis]|uniref:hypothetical protein n=1 Tax=Streptomyces mirabilis TaxID=68239 RepID=UPI00366455C8
MPSTRPKPDFVKPMSRMAGAAAALALGASLMAAPQAVADSDPGVRNLLQACSWADVCEFHPQQYWTYLGPAHHVGESLYNCGHNTNSTSIAWSDTTGSSNSVGVSISQGAKFADVFETEIQVTYSHTWLKQHTQSQTTNINVSPGWKGWIERSTAKQQATGWYEIHFGKRYYGHYIWYVRNYKESGPTGAPGVVAPRDTQMNSSELHSICHR